MKKCTYCGKEYPDEATFCERDREPLEDTNPTSSSPAKQQHPEPIANTSGQGTASVVPDEIRGWNWGAFVMTWLWAAFNGAFDTKTLILAFAFIPVSFISPLLGAFTMFITGVILAFYCGNSGNERAWRRKKWISIEQFKSVQTAWSRVGLSILGVLGIIVVVSLVVFFGKAPR